MQRIIDVTREVQVGRAVGMLDMADQALREAIGILGVSHEKQRGNALEERRDAIVQIRIGLMDSLRDGKAGDHG